MRGGADLDAGVGGWGMNHLQEGCRGEDQRLKTPYPPPRPGGTGVCVGIQEAQEAPKVFLEGPEAVLVPWAEEGETSGLEEAMWRSPGLSQMILEQLGYSWNGP
ncbi:hypothetical protein H1C71_029877 [Ictidomys tridecemlineatus]|nr:hypothetical protein H1C71_029877 [Ictidomys tridecemlineatus]KAG3260163.1 hypothetical protein H1C71_029877 [Ictidomys tridecemlineatus]KAG3260164.1 hypothetical protein H1C71_029877 [Ictidomys tridecemlineatus]KAG3260165.1 hypothetical protein H1C71_029877 [Ictidomys tridecemlineatus]KAG3260173.1 hypothetical protein H1C71_029877 [Ictidomys tridecemlineatus]